MIKIRSPREGIDLVTFLAIRAEAGKRVTRVLCGLVVCAVTTIARNCSSGILMVCDI
jgi:hypothetical protein